MATAKTKKTASKTKAKATTKAKKTKVATKPKAVKETKKVAPKVEKPVAKQEVKKVEARPEPVTAKPVTKKAAEPKVSKRTGYHGVGRRKAAVARVWIRAGKGSVTVNGKDYLAYFDTDISKSKIVFPLMVSSNTSRYDVHANVEGGGMCAQADAVQLGLSRALVGADESLKPVLKQYRLLTVDSRVKERKKYGQKGARRRFQFVKR